MDKNFYITTTLPYVNADPHIGFALEIIQADAIARYKRLTGHNVIFNTGTDEHGIKIYKKALEENKDPKAYCDEYAAKFKNLKTTLNLSYTHFIRTTDEHHIKAAQEFWKLCDKNGNIYKKNYKIKYCVGCELEKTDSDLVNDCCPIHPNLELETIEEENYFFRFSKYQQKLLELYINNPAFVVPEFRLKEIENFISKGLEDFSISRLKKKMPWGIDVPGDPEHVMYVWFDALINYISTLGWPENEKQFTNFWPGIQIAGKDNLRQQSAMWQAMLMSAGIAPSRQILIHGFITSAGQKMSKSLGNVVDPYQIVKQYGIDAVRYYLLKEIPTFDDGDYSQHRMHEIYNADLANGLGNLVSRVAKLSETNNIEFAETKDLDKAYEEEWAKALLTYDFNIALQRIWLDISIVNEHINQESPWAIKDKTKLKEILQEDVDDIRKIAVRLKPFLPQTAEKIEIQFKGPTIKSHKPLFPRLTK